MTRRAPLTTSNTKLTISECEIHSFFPSHKQFTTKLDGFVTESRNSKWSI
jgi:hypothetical protein